MRTHRFLICAGLVLCSPAIADDHRAEDYRALLDEAVGNIDWDYWEDWAYTETALRDEVVWAGRYDPRRDDDEHWTLISVDGEEPTSRQQREYRHDQDENRHKADADDNGVTGIVEAETIELVEETDEYWLFTFLPTDDDKQFLQGLDARMKITKDGRYVEYVDVRSKHEIKPGYGTTISEFLTHLAFGPVVPDGPIVPFSINIRIKGRALLFIGFSEVQAVKRTNFEYAGD